ncbi:MAG: lipopolysaccharide heptosyltransferase II [Phycisphaerae bacterium]|nr:lipopolysaccharide heptosyltransferase II [Phycisphaerae bacterium]
MMNSQRLLIWLPSPLGDAIMATPALRAFRSNLPDTSITFLAPAFTRQILSPSSFCDDWLEMTGSFTGNLKQLKAGAFDTAILLKNSFSSALTVRLAGIGRRIGYARDMRSVLLTDRISPVRDENGRFKPLPMIDYYLGIASFLEMTSDNLKTELSFTADQQEAMLAKLPQLKDAARPLVILVPGGAFGPSKLWPTERYAELADRLNQTCGATVLISVAPIPKEIEIAEAIRSKAKTKIINLGLTPLNGGQLKALFGSADLVVTNDTGPRHIAIALGKPVVSLFGPNNPQWTQSGHNREIQITGKAPCVPCDKPTCEQKQHLCMESITVDSVFDAAMSFLKS